ncbi:MAG TPA: CPBP family intramembrane glutamic endopeptidase [Planctomycetota bacterium]|nr:CPBP family intramembrane glutamic endopeptidase [Planctomycetota bacterium]
MRPSVDFAVRTGAAFLAALALSPALGVLFPEEPFHRVMTRTFQFALVVALAVRRGPVREWPAKLRAIGFRGPERKKRALLGVAVGISATALLLLVSWALGGRPLVTEPHRLPLALHLLVAAGAGIGVGLFEEIFFRGYLKDAVGGIASAFFYAVVHFIAPIGRTDPAGPVYDPLLAVKRLPELNAWTDPQRAGLGIPCLIVLGLALNRLRERTGSLYLGMGIHAGIVFVLALYGRFLVMKLKDEDAWIFGGAFARDGVLPLLALLSLLLASYRAPLPPWARA